jgi:SAM-dependent methyltransferase
MAMSEERIAEIVNDLMRRPGHEAVRVNVWGLLTEGLGVKTSEIDHEKREVTGRLDALLGRTIFEFKSNLTNEKRDAEIQLPGYIRSREAQTGAHYIGVATDGARFIAYDVAQGELRELKAFSPSRERPGELLVWLSSVISIQSDLDPEPDVIRRELGRESFAYGVARHLVSGLWESVKDVADVRLKRDLWATQLARVYGDAVGDDELFLQHTYLTVVAKTMATLAVGIPLPDARDPLSGKAFEDASINGAVESDFFDWITEASGGDELVNRIARQVARFRLENVRIDVLKALYESLIDPEQRHDLGEYYTPDWLAAMVCERAITDPLNQRVLDPACGSGTFVFHAVRRFLAAAEAAGWDNPKVVDECSKHVFGIDVHPVAAIIARVTYLLALGNRLTHDRASVSIPVYLGDSLQWDTTQFVAEGEVMIGVPGGDLLQFPATVATNPATFDAVVEGMLQQSDLRTSVDGFRAWLQRQHGIIGDNAKTLADTYALIQRLKSEDRDHIWGYVARNLSRPVWLSSTGQRAHVVVGNPPWLSYRYMSSETQQRFRSECQRRGVWAGGKVATHQDLSAYFFARCAELYLQGNGTIAFVMPYAALNRKQFEGFRTGWWGSGRGTRRAAVFGEARFEEAWTFDEHVQPLFPVPSCVLIATRRSAGPLPGDVTRYRGRLPRRDATSEEASAALTTTKERWPAAATLEGGSPYREAFRQGATMVPRMLCVVERVAAGPLGGDARAPVVHSRRTRLEKEPWKSLGPLQSRVEAEFLRPLYLGESVAPFRLLEPALCVIPWDADHRVLLDAGAAQGAGRPHLAGWMSSAEALWDANKRGTTTAKLKDWWDYNAKLSAQFPPAARRVLFSASGTLPAVAVVRDRSAAVEHGAYWAPVSSDSEAYYLAAILNSEAARAKVAAMQARGQWGARHFDKVMFELPIPEFDGSVKLHRELADAAGNAERVAAGVALPERGGFIKARQIIREALRQDGIAGRIDALVTELLDG